MNHTNIGKPRRELLCEELTTPVRANTFDLFAKLPFGIVKKLTHPLGSLRLAPQEVNPSVPGVVIDQHQDIPVFTHS